MESWSGKRRVLSGNLLPSYCSQFFIGSRRGRTLLACFVVEFIIQLLFGCGWRDINTFDNCSRDNTYQNCNCGGDWWWSKGDSPVEGKFNNHLLTNRPACSWVEKTSRHLYLNCGCEMQIRIESCNYFVCKLKCDKSSLSHSGWMESYLLNVNKGLSKTAEIHLFSIHPHSNSGLPYRPSVAAGNHIILLRLIIYSEQYP